VEPAFESPSAAPGSPETLAVHELAGKRISRWVSKSVVAWAVIIAAVLTVAAVFVLRPQDPIDAFWAPVWRSGGTVTLAAGSGVDQTLPGAHRPVPANGLNSLDTFRADELGFADAITMARVAGLVRAHGKSFEVRRAASLTLDDLRKVPTVLIGAINNVWTMRLNRELRFSVSRDPATAVITIVDRQDQSKPLWRSDDQAPYSERNEDRAVISRFLNPVTEQEVVLIAGIGRDGTTAAGEFVTESKYMQELAKRAPSGWRRKNLQVVISTEVINGNVGPPRVVAFCFW
jgi:hypothetical protein